MITYGNGILGGAARVISKVVTTVAGWIARFFESHSPPEEDRCPAFISGVVPS